ncbi:Ste13p NDAI_0E02240 [Naumovozyma dairenensis CBS 421]|uniref:Dipeptidyl aminopeptidase A n=1 Tax=Naumovozyma dairenensis (strain ATCC 10597 / BCRC 20456 / CBS 421 / NBRC 0211 / NRRL Y-12639) TaxID=1071378 RepID=G0WBC1_NAUDC|nr:hypothetical protein NDAI_0E02240 [Naumovozyma dairenensis CBS 421]CCD25041.1 hypothetical protein NDAI_0E02240 [Naumovozyma dairenensis CBS 421]
MSTFIKTHKRKNSHKFLGPQATSGASMRSDFEMDDMGDIPPPLNLHQQTQEEEQRQRQRQEQQEQDGYSYFTETIPDIDLEQQSLREQPSSFLLDDDDERLSSSPTPDRNLSWESWYIHKKYSHNKNKLLCISTSALLLVFFIVIIPMLNTPSDSSRSNGKNGNLSRKRNKFTINDIFNGDFSVDHKTFHFIEPASRLQSHDMDPGLYYTVEDKDLGRHFVAKQLFNKDFEQDLGSTKFFYDDKEYTVMNVIFNYRLDRAILMTDIVPEFRHSSKGYYFLKDLNTNKITPITPPASNSLEKLSYAAFSPSYNYVYFVYENNLYLKSAYNDGKVTQITNDGSSNILNAKTGWIYEEEVLASDKGIWWAPDDSKFVFAKINETDVPSYQFPLYTTGNQFPLTKEIKYPKPGTPNPKIQLYMLDLINSVLYQINTGNKDYDFILYDAQWVSSDFFLFKETDRASKIMNVKSYNAKESKLEIVRKIDSTKYNGWIEKTFKILPIPPKKSLDRTEFGYVDIAVDQEGYNHLFYFPTVNSTEGKQLTKGQWEVTDRGIVGFEYESDTIFFTANQIGPMAQHLYAVSLSDERGDDHYTVQTLQDPNQKNDYYDFELSSSGRFAMAKYLGSSTPQYRVGPLSDVLDANSESGRVINLTDDSEFKEALEKYNLPVTSYKNIVLDDGVTINYIEIKPAFMDPKKKYPVLVNVYGGPGSQTFTTKSSFLLEQAVASGLDAIVLQIEPRGTGTKGWKFRSWAKKKLGFYEPRDVTEVVQKFIKMNEPHIDRKRVAIWGWSYGGFTTLKTIEYDKGETFTYAMAVAPVTNWTFYDSIYTERYMDAPLNNEEGYRDISVVKDVEPFKNLNRFLIIHGTADDNVHIQNSYEFLDKLNLAGIRNYDMHIFPDSDHSIRYHNAQVIIYQKLYYWLETAFNGKFDNVNM